MSDFIKILVCKFILKGNDKYGKKPTKLEALNDLFIENGITSDDIEVHDRLIHEIKKNADAILDYRHPSYARHLLGDIVIIVFFAVLRNANEWGEIESFAKRKKTERENRKS